MCSIMDTKQKIMMGQDRRKFSREACIEKTTGEIYVGFWKDQRKKHGHPNH